MNEQIRVGDVVAWADVPDGALVLFGIEYAARRAHEGFWCVENCEWLGSECEPRWWRWSDERPPEVSVTIIALGLTGQESADDLRRAAEVFEVREALRPCQGFLDAPYSPGSTSAMKCWAALVGHASEP